MHKSGGFLDGHFLDEYIFGGYGGYLPTSICLCFRYMAASLLKVASEHTSVVAVVSKGHLRGNHSHGGWWVHEMTLCLLC